MTLIMLALAMVCLLMTTLAAVQLGLKSFGALLAIDFVVTFLVLLGVGGLFATQGAQFATARTAFYVALVTTLASAAIRWLDRRKEVMR